MPDAREYPGWRPSDAAPRAGAWTNGTGMIPAAPIVHEFVYGEPAVRAAVVRQLPSGVAAVAEVSFACFDADRGYFDWLADDVVCALPDGGRYLVSVTQLRRAFASLLPDTCTLVAIDLASGRGPDDGGCARCYGANHGDHFHVEFTPPPLQLVSTDERRMLFDRLVHADLLDDEMLIWRNVIGLELLRDGVAPRGPTYHYVGRLEHATLDLIASWPEAERRRVGRIVVLQAECESDLFYANALKSLGVRMCSGSHADG